ncbi:MAG: ATP-binding cassette domain-containing protein [Gammaproteobacteria bacterium]|nr:ATP-binding cassette domain-containing protein [Gammaproteobacteria bacterium]
MIEINHLTKQFGAFTAVDDLSFTVQPGEVLGFLGPNGAGKSTTMKMITGFLTPTSGSVKVCGHDVAEEPVVAKRLMGYLPEGAPAYGDMTVQAFLEFIAQVRGLNTAQAQQRIAAVVDQVNLHKVLHKNIDTLSKGYGRRVGLAQAILHDPQILILDEPTDGLDPNQKHEVRKLIESMAQDKIIIVSTHILEEVEAVCSRAVIIADGKLLADDKPQVLAAQSKYHDAVSLTVEGEDAAVIAAELETLEGVAAVETNAAGRITVLPKAGETIYNTVKQHAETKGWALQELYVEQGRLDQVFRKITLGEELSRSAA